MGHILISMAKNKVKNAGNSMQENFNLLKLIPGRFHSIKNRYF